MNDVPEATRRDTAAPLVSVLMPAYERTDLLPRAIASVLAQTHRDFELVIVDDGSKADISAAVARFGDPRIRFFRNPVNRGAAATRNRLVELARGEFVAFLDHDDEWAPEKLARQLAVFAAGGPGLGVVYTGLRRVAAGRKPIVVQPRYRGDVAARMRERDFVGTLSSVMARRSAVLETGPFDPALRRIEDWDFMIRLSRCCAFDFVPEPCATYYFGDPGHISTPSAKVFLDMRRTIKRTLGGARTRRERSAHAALQAMQLQAMRRYPSLARRLAMLAVILNPTEGHARRAALALLFGTGGLYRLQRWTDALRRRAPEPPLPAAAAAPSGR